MNYDEALENAFNWSESKPPTMNKQACNAYIRAIPLAYEEAKGMNLPIHDALWVQSLYILNNTRGWKGEEARQSKQILSDKKLLTEWVDSIPEDLINISELER
jgi:hypothetical protein